jgi:hypothetical protein
MLMASYKYEANITEFKNVLEALLIFIGNQRYIALLIIIYKMLIFLQKLKLK